MLKRLSISVLLQAVTGLMAIVLVASFAIVAGDAYKRMRTAERVLATADIARDLFTAMQALRIERGTINTAIETAEPVDTGTRDAVGALRAQSDAAFDSALTKFTHFSLKGTGPAITGIREDRQHFVALRQQADAALAKPRDERPLGLSATWIVTGNKLFDALDALSEILSSDIVQADPAFAEMMKIKQLAWTTREAAGVDRLLVGAAIAQGNGFSIETRLQTAGLVGRMDAVWKLIEDDMHLEVTPLALRTAVGNARRLYFDGLRARR
jgi:methyl-accepting chemotaxis protein